jgi:hypothetical protein
MISMRLIGFRSSILLLAAVCSILCGCESMESVGSTVKDRFSGVPPKVRTVDGNPRQVYEAARQAMEGLGYEFTSGGPAQGRLEGLSRIGEGDNFRSSRQRSISIHLQDMDGGKVEVQVQMTEIVEEDSNRSTKPATETSLRDSPAFDIFFSELERCLPAAKAK